MRIGENIRLRKDGRYEARYIKSRTDSGKLVYGYCYGKTYEEAKEKREYQLHKINKPREMNLLILGAGSHGDDVYEIAKKLRIFNKIDFLDDDIGLERTIGVWNDAEDLFEEYPMAIVAVGDEATRRRWMEKLSVLGFIIPTLIHPTAFIPEGVVVGNGTVICARSTISTGVTIGKGCIVTSGSTVSRKTTIPDYGYFDFDQVIHYRETYIINEKANKGIEQ